MVEYNKILKPKFKEEDIGLLLWQIQKMENFYPIYKTMIKKE